jgi:hypothetical protein
VTQPYLICFAYSLDISFFLWNEPQPSVANKMFPLNEFGTHILTRDRVVTIVMDSIAAQLALHPSSSPSVYLAGCRGSGKTSLQMLLAAKLKSQGYVVYFFEDAAIIPQNASMTFKNMLKSSTTKVAVLIDEVANNPSSAIFTTLLKGQFPHLVTIGSAVPRYFESGAAARFREVLRMTDLVLKESDDDFQRLIQFCVKSPLPS